MATDAITEFAPAKINLCLHVTGRRTDGYHLLDSLVVFAGVGDEVTATRGQGLTLEIIGPGAAGLDAGEDNLVLRAARAMGVADAHLTLWKALPIASGIGGGSADAAATLRALARLTGRPLPDPAAVLALGADVPVCLAGHAVRMRGVGEALSPLPQLPPLACLLVNPRVPVPTSQVFAGLASRQNPGLPEVPSAALRSAADFAAWLEGHTRNDMVPAARTIAPVLGQAQSALEAVPGCLLARMSGSGGTHFGLFATLAEATVAERTIRAADPGWWTAVADVQDHAAAPDQALTAPEPGRKQASSEGPKVKQS
ncbi:4-(cytidine 5'-diphospho)-2-C-methyl-D-erythritol kinase [Tabrizicola sp.]|uniref:4-(cytidine 5'-diphospho)-2-C-methyl-D-erythritol kinase n=1 Tax=Tabrizicola sp. TaxID=2005166 RepID=UPI003F3F7E22